jgi:predicted AAA+ superfamily ATPase
MVIEELIARTLGRWVRPEIHYWRTRAGGEVDLLLGSGRRLVAVEIKLSTSSGRDPAGLACMKVSRRLRSPCAEPRDIGRDVHVIPWQHLAKGGEVAGLP